MELDLETFLTLLYVMTDDLYVSVVLPQLPASGGPEPKLSDSEVLCLGLAAQWRSGVAWKTERGFVRYALKHLRPYFPGMTSQSAFNRRLRRLWGAFILIQQAIVDQLWSAQECEIMDCAPVPVARGVRAFHPGWLADIARIGKGGNDRYFYGLHLIAGGQHQWGGHWLDPGRRQHSGPLAGRTALEQSHRSAQLGGAGHPGG